jgi:integrase
MRKRRQEGSLTNVGGVWIAHLEWVNFHVMRRTHSSLMREKNVDPKLVADQLGHSLDVNLNVYTDTALRLRKEAADMPEFEIVQADCAVDRACNS